MIKKIAAVIPENDGKKRIIIKKCILTLLKDMITFK